MKIIGMVNNDSQAIDFLPGLPPQVENALDHIIEKHDIVIRVPGTSMEYVITAKKLADGSFHLFYKGTELTVSV